MRPVIEGGRKGDGLGASCRARCAPGRRAWRTRPKSSTAGRRSTT